MRKRSKPPESLGEHLADVFRQEFSSFDRRKFWKELLYGSTGTAVIGLIISIARGLSIKSDWDDHPGVVICVTLLPASVLIADVLWRCWRAIRRIYRERDG